MSGKRFSARANSCSASAKMSLTFDHDTAALRESCKWLEDLTFSEFRGRGDTVGAARGRVAKRIGIKLSYADRLWNKAAEMTGVAGGAYRALKLAYEANRISFDEIADPAEVAELQNARKRHAEFIRGTERLAAVRAAADAPAMGGERQSVRCQMGGMDRARDRGPDE